MPIVNAAPIKTVQHSVTQISHSHFTWDCLSSANHEFDILEYRIRYRAVSRKSQDVLVLLKLVAPSDKPRTYNSLTVDLILSPSQVYAAVRRAISSDLAYEAEGWLR